MIKIQFLLFFCVIFTGALQLEAQEKTLVNNWKAWMRTNIIGANINDKDNDTSSEQKSTTLERKLWPKDMTKLEDKYFSQNSFLIDSHQDRWVIQFGVSRSNAVDLGALSMHFLQDIESYVGIELGLQVNTNKKVQVKDHEKGYFRGIIGSKLWKQVYLNASIQGMKGNNWSGMLSISFFTHYFSLSAGKNLLF